MVTIKLRNGLGSLFETYLTMLSQKARDDNKLPDLQAHLFNLEDKERRMKQNTKVNLAQSQSTGSGSTSSRGGFSSGAQGSRGGRGQSRSGRKGSGTTKDTSGATGTGESSASSSSSNQNNPRCNPCSHHHASKKCPNTDFEYHVCGERGHIHQNCLIKAQLGGQQGPNSTSSNLMIEMVQTNIAATTTEEFPVIEEAPASDIFLGIIYTTVLKLLATLSPME